MQEEPEISPDGQLLLSPYHVEGGMLLLPVGA